MGARRLGAATVEDMTVDQQHTMWTSQDVDEALWSTTSRVRVSPRGFVPSSQFTPATDIPPFDELLARLCTEMTAEHLLAGHPVTLAGARYSHGLATNERPDLATELETDESDQPVALSRSLLANTLGVTAVTLTADDRVVLVRQGAGNSVGAGMLAQGGSGGVAFADLAGGGRLTAVVARAAVRELCEESRVRREEVGQVTVTGFGRWSGRGAKPEFFALACVNVAADELAERPVGEAEARFSGALESVPARLLTDTTITAAEVAEQFGSQFVLSSEASWNAARRFVTRHRPERR